MRKSFMLLALLAAPIYAQNANYLSITTNFGIKDSSGTVMSGTFCAFATDSNDNAIPFLAGDGAQVPKGKVCRDITAGTLATSLQLANPKTTNPLNINYHFTVTNGTTKQATDYPGVYINVAAPINTWDWSLMTPGNGLNIPINLAVGPQGPPGAGFINGLASDGANGITVTAGITVGTTKILDSGSYSTLAAACSDAVSKNATLFISRSWSALTTQSCAANISFPVGGTGAALLQPASGQTLTLSGSIVFAPLAQIFDPSAGGTVLLTKTPIVYPEWFGAVGNGTAIDSPAIQAAIASTTATLALTKTYKISSQLYVLAAQSGLTIKGPGKITHGTTLSQYAPLIGTAPNSSILVYTSTNVTIKDLIIDQTGLTTTACDGILYFTGSNYGTVEGNTILNATGMGIHFYHQNNDAIISKNTIVAPILDGINFHSASHRARISDNVVRDVGGVGTTSSAGVAYEVEGRIGGNDLNIQLVTDVTLSNNQAISGTQTTSQAYLVDWSQNVTITGGTVNNLGGVDLLFDQGVTVSGVTFLNCPWAVAVSTQGFTHNWTGAAVGSSSQDVTIAGNTWVYTSTYPVSPRYPGIYTNDSGLDIRVIGNPVANLVTFPTSGVYYALLSTLGAPTGATVSGNTLTGGFTNFITNASNIVAENNGLGLAFGAAVMTFPAGAISHVIFRHNVVDNMNTLQIANASSTVTDVDISGNVFKALNQTDGIFTPGTATLVRVNISGNHFWDTSKVPIALTGATATSDTIISDNIAVGSVVGSSGATISGNSFSTPNTAAAINLPTGSTLAGVPPVNEQVGTVSSVSGTVTTAHTFTTAFSATPNCSASALSNAGAWYFSTLPSTTSSGIITYATSGAQTFNVQCVGAGGLW